MSTRICLLALIGLPATGKTTFSKWLLELSQKSHNVIHICYDDFLQQPRDAEFEFKKRRTKILSFISELIYAMKNAGRLPKHITTSVKVSLRTDSQDFLIICDDNNYYRSMRYKLYQLCRQNECAYAQIYFGCELRLALARNGARPVGERATEQTMQRMASRLETPDPETQHWESNTFILIECENYNVMRDRILEFLSKTFEKTLNPLPVKAKAETVQSLVHQLDLLLRRRIGEILHLEHFTTDRNQMANALNRKRKEVLQNVKIKAEKEDMSFDDLNGYVNLLN